MMMVTYQYEEQGFCNINHIINESISNRIEYHIGINFHNFETYKDELMFDVEFFFLAPSKSGVISRFAAYSINSKNDTTQKLIFELSLFGIIHSFIFEMTLC